jgi:sulfur carrier protein ThiS
MRVAILLPDSYNAIESMPCCRFILVPGGEVRDCEIHPGETYEEALLALDIIPDTVLIFYRGTSLPQDKPVEEDEVEIIETCSRG